MHKLESHNNTGWSPFSVHFSEVMYSDDPGVSKFGEVIRKEIESLIKRKTWTVVCRSDVLDDASILTCRVLFGNKDAVTQREVWKAGFILQGHGYL